MKSLFKKNDAAMTEEAGDYFHWGATIIMSLLLLAFIATTFYLGISIYLDK